MPIPMVGVIVSLFILIKIIHSNKGLGEDGYKNFKCLNIYFMKVCNMYEIHYKDRQAHNAYVRRSL